MATSLEARPAIVIRDVSGTNEIRAVEDLQIAVWGFGERDVIPLTQLIPSADLGGMLLGAFDGGVLAGFVYGFVGLDEGRPVIHSEMLAVREGYRDRGIGWRLKLAQRERALARGFRRMTWTFDPLQSRNAYFNFSKLGAVSSRYKVNYYGESTSSYLHAHGTDRLWVEWEMDSPRAAARVAGERAAPLAPGAFRILECGAGGEPRLHALEGAPEVVCLEVPASDNGLVQSPEAARRWREATRQAFTEAFAAGCAACEFHTLARGERRVGVYELRPRAGLT